MPGCGGSGSRAGSWGTHTIWGGGWQHGTRDHIWYSVASRPPPPPKLMCGTSTPPHVDVVAATPPPVDVMGGTRPLCGCGSCLLPHCLLHPSDDPGLSGVRGPPYHLGVATWNTGPSLYIYICIYIYVCFPEQRSIGCSRIAMHSRRAG